MRLQNRLLYPVRLSKSTVSQNTIRETIKINDLIRENLTFWK